MTALALQLRALRYETVRLCILRESRVVVVLTLLAAIVSTLPAAREIAVQAPGPDSFAWVATAGTVGRILPAPAAAVGAAWFGAMSLSSEYRYRGALITFAALPRRGMVLAARLAVVTLFSALLSAAVQACAYAMAWLGFALAARGEAAPFQLAVPQRFPVAVAVGCGLVGVFAAAVVRLRLVAVPLALLIGVFAVAAAPRSDSPALPFAARALGWLPQELRFVHPTDLAIAVTVSALVLGIVAVLSQNRRRIG